MKTTIAIFIASTAILAGCSSSENCGAISFECMHPEKVESAEIRYLVDGKCVAIVSETAQPYMTKAAAGLHEVSIEFNGKTILKSSINVVEGSNHPVYVKTPKGA